MLEDVSTMIDRRTIIAGIVGLVVGGLIGWILLGWVLFPVTWTNADPWDLRPEQAEVYIRLVADSYSVNEDAELARQRMAGFDRQEVSEMLGTLTAEAEEAGDAEEKRRLEYLGLALDLTAEAPAPGAEPTPQPSAGGVTARIRSLLPICGLLLVVLVILALAGVIAFRFLQGAGRVPARGVREELVGAAEPEEGGLGHFVTTYNFGDDGYDTSFNIETPGPESEFYGACGVGFSEIMGEGSPDKIVAFEIWLFDKTDMDNVQTITKVVMSEFAYSNQILRAKMKDRGEPVLVQKGKPIVIDALGLRLKAEIVDFAYGTDPALPPNGYFESLTTELVPMFKA
jgi:hypothetical protein